MSKKSMVRFGDLDLSFSPHTLPPVLHQKEQNTSSLKVRGDTPFTIPLCHSLPRL